MWRQSAYVSPNASLRFNNADVRLNNDNGGYNWNPRRYALRVMAKKNEPTAGSFHEELRIPLREDIVYVILRTDGNYLSTKSLTRVTWSKNSWEAAHFTLKAVERIVDKANGIYHDEGHHPLANCKVVTLKTTPVTVADIFSPQVRLEEKKRVRKADRRVHDYSVSS